MEVNRETSSLWCCFPINQNNEQICKQTKISSVSLVFKSSNTNKNTKKTQKAIDIIVPMKLTNK